MNFIDRYFKQFEGFNGRASLLFQKSTRVITSRNTGIQ